MKIFVTAKTNSKREGVEKISKTEFIVRVAEPPQEGKANRAIVRALSEYFGVPQSTITLLTGLTSKNKVFDIPK